MGCRANRQTVFARSLGDNRAGRGTPGLKPGTDTAVDVHDEPVIVCRQCRFTITRPAEALVVNGAHRHTFANPHGLVFEVACFRSAPGCAHTGAATDDFTWFRGYAWRIALCGGCLAHLGWHYEAPVGDVFHGLIVDHLILPQSD